MSYNLPLEHKLLFDNIHDMITIDMKPVTNCSLMRDSMHVTGYLEFAGTFLTVELGEEAFNGIIPVDITLPYFGGSSDVRLEITGFDYDVVNKESLTLRLEVEIVGYEEVPPAVDAFISEIEQQPLFIDDADVPDIDEINHDLNDIPYSPLVPVTSEMIREADALIFANEDEEESFVDTFDIEDSYDLPVERFVEEIELKVEDTFEVEQIKQVIQEQPSEPAWPFEEIIESFEERTIVEEIDEPVQHTAVEAVDSFVETPVTTSSPFSPRFIIEKRAEKKIKEQVAAQREEELELLEEKTVEVKNISNLNNDSVARQFADGQTRVKMVYVRSESELLGEVLERNSARVEDVWNLSKLDDVVRAGDCVMIRYDKSE